MLRLLYSIPCEKSIIDETGTTSLITILERAEVFVPPQAPEKFLLPRTWTVVTLWTRDDNPVPSPVDYEQRIEVVDVDNLVIFKADTLFTVSEQFRNFRNTSEFPAYPVFRDGIVLVNLFLRLKAGNEEWEKYHTFPIAFVRTTIEAPNESQADTEHENNAPEGIARV